MSKQPYTIESYDNERDWLAARVKSIGSSEAAAVLGYSRFCGPLGLFVRKQEGRCEDDGDNEPGAMMEWGHRLEEAMARKLEDVYEWENNQLKDPGDHALFRSTERPHITATPDRLKYDGSILEGEAQLKTSHYDAFKAWKTQVPIAYQIQCQQSMYVLGTDVTWIAVLGGGYQFKHFRVERNQRFIDRLLERLDDFWHNYVEAGVQPAADYSLSSAAALKQLYPHDNGKSIDLPPELENFGTQYDLALSQRNAADKRAKELGNLVKQAMGDATVGVLPDSTGFTWKEGSRGRTLRRKQKCGGPV